MKWCAACGTPYRGIGCPQCYPPKRPVQMEERVKDTSDEPMASIFDEWYLGGDTGTSVYTPGLCSHCGGYHSGQCPRIRAIEYHPNGTIKRIEYHSETDKR